MRIAKDLYFYGFDPCPYLYRKFVNESDNKRH